MTLPHDIQRCQDAPGLVLDWETWVKQRRDLQLLPLSRANIRIDMDTRCQLIAYTR